MTKKELRLDYLKKRAALSEEEHAEASQRISDRFFSYIDMASIQLIHTFLPIPAKQEPNTYCIIDRIKKTFPHTRISVPKIDFENNKLLSVYYEDQPLKKNKWGILEPQKAKIVHSEDIDAIIIPLLAYDVHGYRLGYGKGYYDQFLLQCRMDCRRIGISFFPPADTILADKWDIPLNCCLTPKRVYLFSLT